jgi:hypothetical protein
MKHLNLVSGVLLKRNTYYTSGLYDFRHLPNPETNA